MTVCGWASRAGRKFLSIAMIGSALIPMAAAEPGADGRGLTARLVVERIQKKVGIPWRSDTVDTFKAGNPDTVVTGIATTFAATLDVLQRAAARGKNLIITHEPTFYNHLDKTGALEHDAVLEAKRAFIDSHGLVIWRFHDYWHARKPDGILRGVTSALGWESFRNPKDDHLFVFPEITLDTLAVQVRSQLNIRTLRVVGDRRMPVRRAALLPGAVDSLEQIRMLERDDVDALVIGETREWETVEYVRDAISAGKKKALIILGHVASEEAGMQECARWLKTFIPEVPIEFIPAGEPFWSPP